LALDFFKKSVILYVYGEKFLVMFFKVFAFSVFCIDRLIPESGGKVKKRTKWIIGGVLIISLIVVGSVYAFKKGNVDGVWGTIDPLQNLDIIGTIGDNPGTGWSNEDRSTYDATIRRNANICYGDTDGSDTFDLSGYTGFPNGTTGGLGSHSATCNGNDLIISEYVHTSSGQRAIEIYNPSLYAISLMGYKIQIYYDGNTSVGTTIALTTGATLASRHVWVVSYNTITDVTDQTSTSLNFDGNDVVALVRGGTAGSDYTGAECDNWATGPTGTNPDGNPTTWKESWFNQGSNTTDWNQVRYGRPGIDQYSDDCPGSTDTAGFLLQSGFGFDGAAATEEDYQQNVPFVLGVFCHYNNPIYLTKRWEKLQSVPLNVTVSDLKCDDGSTPDDGSSMEFTYYMRLDETINTGIEDPNDCPYLSTTPCSDAVFVSQPPASQKFTCSYGPLNKVEYTIAPLGFMARNANGTCPTWNAALAKRDFISEEGTTNCGCLYGMITDMVVTEVQLLYFNAEPGEGVITLQWATATERDNYGFNLYRATSEDGERTLLNAELIPSLVAPGSPFGAEYEFVDSTAEAGVQYYYWLEDVDIYMLSTLHGPAAAILE